MTHTELQALKILLYNYSEEAKRGEKSAKAWADEADKEQEAEDKRQLESEADFARGLACGYGLARNQLEELVKAVEKDLTPRREY